MRPRTNKVCIQAEVMRMQRHDRIFGIIAKDLKEQHGMSWVQAKSELKRKLTFKNMSLCLQ